MNKDDAQLIIEKERLKKEKIRKRMHEYRNNNEFRKKNADYMKDYRQKQKKLLEDANKVINNELKDKDKDKDKKYIKSEKTIKKYISIIVKNHKLINKTVISDSKLLSKLFTEKLDNNEEIILQNELSYLKDINKFTEIMKNKYTNILTLRDNITPYLIILQKIQLFKVNYAKLNKFYSELKKK